MENSSKDKNIGIGNSYSIFFGVFNRVRLPNGNWVVRIVWSRLLALFAFVVFALWLFLTLAIYAFFKFARDYDEMSVSQAITYPFDRSALRMTIGDYNIKKAEEYIKERKWREAYMNLAFGVGAFP